MVERYASKESALPHEQSQKKASRGRKKQHTLRKE
jgi:predicted GIY-YIG superfamily endonuclease